MGACQSTINGNSTIADKQLRLAFRDKHMTEWTVMDVRHWLLFVCDGEFKSLAPIFKQNNINGQKLKNITDKEIKRLIKNTFTATRFRLLRNAQMTILVDDDTSFSGYYRRSRGIDRGKPERCALLRCSSFPDGIIQIIIQYSFKSRFVLN